MVSNVQLVVTNTFTTAAAFCLWSDEQRIQFMHVKEPKRIATDIGLSRTARERTSSSYLKVQYSTLDGSFFQTTRRSEPSVLVQNWNFVKSCITGTCWHERWRPVEASTHKGQGQHRLLLERQLRLLAKCVSARGRACHYLTI